MKGDHSEKAGFQPSAETNKKKKKKIIDPAAIGEATPTSKREVQLPAFQSLRYDMILLVI